MEKELTLLEKFQQGWEIRGKVNRMLITDMGYLKNGNLWVRWENRCIVEYTKVINFEVVAKPPRERRWVNVSAHELNTGVFGAAIVYATKESAEHNAKIENTIATLCIERVDGRWVLVDEKGGAE